LKVEFRRVTLIERELLVRRDVDVLLGHCSRLIVVRTNVSVEVLVHTFVNERDALAACVVGLVLGRDYGVRVWLRMLSENVVLERALSVTLNSHLPEL
jgi:hypothetical protein